MIFLDHTKIFHKLYFPNFPREIGFPKRFNGNSFSHFIEEALKYHHENNSFIQLYNNDILDKIWSDYDNSNTILVFREVRDVYKALLNTFEIDPKNIDIVYTGKKGYHLYIENEPISFEMETELDEKGNEFQLDATSSKLDKILTFINDKSQTADSPLFTDTHRMVRMPGIQRPNKSFAIALNPAELFKYNSFEDYFHEFDYSWYGLFTYSTKYLENKYDEGYGLSKRKHSKNYFERMNKFIDDSGWVHEDKVKKKALENRLTNEARSFANIENKTGFAEAVDTILKRLLSKENYYAINTPNPVHNARVTYALRLLHLGFEIEDIVKFSSTLNWIDFSYDETRKKVTQLRDTYIR